MLLSWNVLLLTKGKKNFLKKEVTIGLNFKEIYGLGIAITQLDLLQ